MDLAKKIFIYSMILLGLLITAVLSAGAYMYLVPGAKLFGYYFVSGSLRVNETTYDTAYYDYNRLEIITKGYDIFVYPYVVGDGDDADIMVYVTDGVSGYANSENNTFSVRGSYSEVTQVFTIEVVEPTGGIMFYNNANIKIAVPELTVLEGEDVSTIEKEISITSAGGRILLGDVTPAEGSDIEAQTLELSDVVINNTNAEIYVRNCEISNVLSIDNNSGRVFIENDIAGDVIIDSKIASFMFMVKEGYNLVSTHIYGNLTVNATNSSIDVGNIEGNLSYEGDSGLLTTRFIYGDVYINVESCEIDIWNVYKNVNIDSDYSEIQIGYIGITDSELYTAIINADNGSVNIGDSFYNLEINTIHGDVSVERARRTVIINTEYGDVEVNCEMLLPYEVNVETLEGDIKATNIIGVANLSVRSNSLATIEAEFAEVNGISTITGGRENVTVQMPINDDYDIELTTTSGGLDVVVGGVYATSWPTELVEGRRYFTDPIEGGAIIGEGAKIVIDTSAGDIAISATEIS